MPRSLLAGEHTRHAPYPRPQLQRSWIAPIVVKEGPYPSYSHREPTRGPTHSYELKFKKVKKNIWVGVAGGKSYRALRKDCELSASGNGDCKDGREQS